MNIHPGEPIGFSSPVLAVRFGLKSEVIAIATADRNLSIYSSKDFLRKSCLADHPTAVESIAFDRTEEVIASGCTAGSIWLWDMVTVNQLTSFPGHRSTCSVLEYHPFGSFFASGSADSNIKIWDARQPRCVQTYRSHTSGITACKFSPHGRWLVSGDEEGFIKFWDLSTGKQLVSHESHRGAISGIDFHPTDFFLISGSADRTTKLWNCESNIVLAGTSEEEDGPVEQVKFNTTGDGLFVASESRLKKFSLNMESKQITCTSSHQLRWEGPILDMVVGADEIPSVATSRDPGFTELVLWSGYQREISVKPKISTPVPSRTYSDGTVEIERKENTKFQELNVPDSFSDSSSRNIQTLGGISEILKNRLRNVSSVVSQWSGGNNRAAIEEAITFLETDPVLFITLLSHLPTERTRTALSVETCTRILQQIISQGLLTLPFTQSQKLIQCMQNLPFSESLPLVLAIDSSSRNTPPNASDLSFIVSVALGAVTYLAIRFGPVLAELRRPSPTVAIEDPIREARWDKANACSSSFISIRELIEDDLRFSRFLKKEKEDTLNAIINSVIQK